MMDGFSMSADVRRLKDAHYVNGQGLMPQSALLVMAMDTLMYKDVRNEGNSEHGKD
jgi:hypothetical protein